MNLVTVTNLKGYYFFIVLQVTTWCCNLSKQWKNKSKSLHSDIEDDPFLDGTWKLFETSSKHSSCIWTRNVASNLWIPGKYRIRKVIHRLDHLFTARTIGRIGIVLAECGNPKTNAAVQEVLVLERCRQKRARHRRGGCSRIGRSHGKRIRGWHDQVDCVGLKLDQINLSVHHEQINQSCLLRNLASRNPMSTWQLHWSRSRW